VIENGAYCTCPCSCVAGSVQIGTVNGYIPMETLTTHDILATPMSSKQSSALEAILASDVADEKVVGIQFSNGASIVSSPNHTFVSPDERVVEARTLLKGQKVKAASGALIEVVADPIEGRYDGRLYNVIVNENSLAPVDHIIDLEGVLSGDWQLQSSNDLVEEEIFLRTSTVRSFK
ncbi:MAG: hypothetical protein KDD35_10135, partial [Bdellovibrionales bacterium]|nr:hypothetical protein [Bdellovibrionales bacterium]